jgi:hypothetical protein
MQHYVWRMDSYNKIRHWYQTVFKKVNTILRLERDSSDENHSDDVSFSVCSESLSIYYRLKRHKLIKSIKGGQEKNKHTPGINLDLVPCKLFISYLFHHW